MALLIIALAFFINFCVSKFQLIQSDCLRKYWFLSLYFVLGVIIGLRSVDDGVDTISYYDAYNLLSNSSLYTAYPIIHMEVGYLLINKLANIVGLDYHSFQLLFSITMMLLYGNFIYKNTRDVYLATLVFLGAGFFAFSFNIMRQMMAIAICTNCWKFLKENKYIKAILLIVIASSFHLTATLYILLLVLYIFKNNLIVRYGFAISLLFLLPLLPIIFKYLQIYGLYANYANFNQEGLKGGFIYILRIIEIIMGIYILFRKCYSSTDKIIANLALFNVAMALLDEHVIYLDRVGLLFFPFVILMFCVVGDRISSPNVRLIYFSGFSLFFLLFFIYRSSDVAQFTLSF